MDELKAKGLDMVLYGVTFFVTVLSYAMTVDILKSTDIAAISGYVSDAVETANQSSMAIIESIKLSFLRSSFVFLSPCALEGINLLCSKVTKKHYLDVTEIVIGVFSVLISIYLLGLVFRGTIPENLQWIQYVLFVYPVKFGINLIDSVLELFKLRRSRD